MRTWSPTSRAAAFALALAAALWPASVRTALLEEPSAAPPAVEAPAPAAPAAAAEAPSGPLPAPPGGVRRDNALLIGGEPAALFWADGLALAEDLPRYAALGFNAVRVPVTSATPDALAAAERLADQAAEAGLRVVVDLRPDPEAFEVEGESAPQSPLDVGYRLAVRRFVRAVVPRLRSHKGVAAWVVSGVDPESVHYAQPDFWAYLQVWHGGLGAINQAWGSRFPTALEIGDASIQRLDASRPGGVGLATLDLARYREQVYSDLLALWADEVHALDRSHALLAGRVHTYRSAISVPADRFDGMVCGFYPGLCENDVLTHNVQGIDIARRGNRLAAIAMLTSELPLPSSRVAGWIAEAVVHGAAGIGFSSWEAIRGDAVLQRAVADALGVTRALDLCPATPRARTAILYEPYAAGAVQAGLPLYGYARGLSDAEPGRLFAALRRGTRFGPVDYITQHELLDLSPGRYGAVLAPEAVNLPESAQRAIEHYVAAGGVFLADLGVGMRQSGGDMTMPPPILSGLFGLQTMARVEIQGTIWTALTTHKRFPSLRVGDSPSENFWSTPFGGLTTFPSVAPDVVPLLSSYELAQQYRGYCGVLMRPVGKGYALYATSRLWEKWLPGNPLFDRFFGDLIGPGSEVAVASPASLTSACEVAPLSDGTLLIHNASAEMAQVLAANPERRVYNVPGGVQSIRPAETSDNSLFILPAGQLLPARPLPITLTPQEVAAYVQVTSCGEDEIGLVVHSGLSQVEPDAEGRLAVTPSGAVAVTVTVRDGRYPVAPRSEHLVSGQPLAKAPGWEKGYRADAAGVLSFRCAAGGALITIKPALKP